MSKYLVETNFCVQKKESGRRLDSATLRMIENQGSCGAYDALTGELGDFALFISGIFPEYLEKRNQQAFYSGVGSAAYWQEFKRTTYDPFYRLAEEFDLFARVIRDARANMIEAENGKLLIPGVPDHPRYKVIFSGSDKTVVIDKSKN